MKDFLLQPESNNSVTVWFRGRSVKIYHDHARLLIEYDNDELRPVVSETSVTFGSIDFSDDEQKRDAAIFLVRSANQDRDIEILGLVAAWFVTNAPLPVVARFLEWIESDDEVE